MIWQTATVWWEWSSPIPTATLLTVCANGYGKRTHFGPHGDDAGESEPPETAEGAETAEGSSSTRYRTQRRGGKGLRDIKTTTRNGPVIDVVRVDDDDEVLMITARGKLQRIHVGEVSVIGRNTQGVRIMSLDEGDELIAVVRVPIDANGDDVEEETAP